MKSHLIISSLILTLWLTIFADEVASETKYLKFSYQDPHLTSYIGTSNFKFSGETSLAATYTISNPGSYVLTSDISSRVGSPSSCILYINSNDVHLDLSGHSLTQVNTSVNINGILINTNLANISIRNGSIRNTTGAGVAINPSVTDIHLEDLFIRGCGQAGISIDGGSGTEIKNISLIRCDIAGCNGAAAADAIALNINYCDFLTALESKFNLSTTTTDTFDAYGVYAQNSKGGTFIDCQACGNTGETIGAGFCLITSCTGFRFSNCIANQNSATDTSASEAYGFYNNVSDGTIFENCSAFYNSCVNKTAGFRVITSKNNTFINCTATGNQISGGNASDRCAGFMIDTYQNFGHNFDSCSSIGNSGGTHASSVSAGFSLDYCNNCILQDCLANSNGITAGYGIGIDILSTSTRCIVQNCQVTMNTSSTASQGIGIRDNASSNSANLLIENFAFGNRDTTSSPTDTNYSVAYSTNNILQEVTLINISGISLPSKDNISITPD